MPFTFCGFTATSPTKNKFVFGSHSLNNLLRAVACLSNLRGNPILLIILPRPVLANPTLVQIHRAALFLADCRLLSDAPCAPSTASAPGQLLRPIAIIPVF
jgi:hypothetical protein